MDSKSLVIILLGLVIICSSATVHSANTGHRHFGGNHNDEPFPDVQALAAVSTSDDAVNRWMLMRRDLLNITIDTDKIDEQPLTADDLLLRMKLMAYVQKLVDKEEKKKAKVAKKTEKANAKAAFYGLPVGSFGPPSPVTVSPPLPVPTAVNLSGSEPLPPTGFWLYKKADFLSKLFSALADAASKLPDVTTETPLGNGDLDTKATTGDDDETEESVVDVNDETEKRSVDDDDSEYESEEDEDQEDGEDERGYDEAPKRKKVKGLKQPWEHYGSKKYHGKKSAHKFHRHQE